jgi:flagellar basal-body rod modification protein FlgD
MSAIDAASSTVASTTPGSSNDFGALSSNEFLEIIFTELTNQDPLSPNETKDLLQQISVIRGIESDTALTDSLKALVNQNSLAQAGALIGKFVSGTTEFGDAAEDFVLSVTSTREGPILNLLNGMRVPMANINEIIDPAAFGAIPTSSGATNGTTDDSTTPSA